jgi:hypothetical protein
VPLDQLLNDAAAALDTAARNISRTWQHQKPSGEELRRLAAGVLATTLRRNLNQPYHSHVATIVTILTGITTDEDYVKKIDKRGSVRGRQ